MRVVPHVGTWIEMVSMHPRGQENPSCLT